MEPPLLYLRKFSGGMNINFSKDLFTVYIFIFINYITKKEMFHFLMSMTHFYLL